VPNRCPDGGFDTHDLGRNSDVDPAVLPERRYAALMVPADPASPAYDDQTTAQIKVHLNNIKTGAALSLANNPNSQWGSIDVTTIPANRRDTIVTITGNRNHTDGLDDSKHPFLVVSQDGRPIMDAILDLKRSQTITVGLFKLHPTDGSEIPAKAPASAAQVETELIKDVGRQANINFTGQVHGVFDQALDFEDAAGKGKGFYNLKDNNGSQFSIAKLQSTMPQFQGIQQLNAFYIQKFNPNTDTGLTPTPGGPSVIRDLAANSAETVEHVTAHELAHHLGADDYEVKQHTNQLLYDNKFKQPHPNPCHLMRKDWQIMNVTAPRITDVSLGPNNTQMVTGVGFGWLPGTATFVSPSRAVPLQITSWSDTQFVYIVPDGLNGGGFQYATANGQKFQ